MHTLAPQRTYTTYRGILALCLFFWGAVAIPCFAYGEEEVRIGLMAPLTGKWASEGEDTRRVLSLLAQQWNASGALGARRLTLVVQDDAGDPRTGALAAQKLLNSGVTAVIGAYGSSVAEATQQLFDEAGIPFLSSGATSVRLTEKGLRHFFRMGPRDDGQSMLAARYLAEQGYKAVAIVHDNTSHPRGFADETKARLQGLGIQVVFYDALTPGQRDHSVLLNKVRAAHPDVLLYTGYYPETGLLLRQKADMRWDIPMLGGDASNHRDLVNIAGRDAARGYSFLSAALPQDLGTPAARSFLLSYTQAYGGPPLSVWSVLAGDGFQAVVNAIARGDNSPAAIGEALHGLEGFPALTGPVAFDAKGDRKGDLYFLYTVDSTGNFVLQPRTVAPAGQKSQEAHP